MSLNLKCKLDNLVPYQGNERRSWGSIVRCLLAVANVDANVDVAFVEFVAAESLARSLGLGRAVALARLLEPISESKTWKN